MRSLLSFGLLLLGSGVLLLTACEEKAPGGDTDAELVFLTRNAPTSYYLDREGEPAGFEYELATAFARHLGRMPRFEMMVSIDDILAALEEGRGDVAAAGLTRTAARTARFTPGPAYQTIDEELLCHPSLIVDEPEDLAGREVRVQAGTSYIDTLSQLETEIEELTWSTEERSTEELLRDVAEGRIDCTVADSNILALNRRFLPPLLHPFAVAEDKELAWFLEAGDNGGDLLPKLHEWLASFEKSGRLRALREKYYGHVQDYDPYDVLLFYRRVESRLPRYRPLFEHAAEKNGLPWTLLAAVSYQESHWNPEAISPTGVRGLMMLTRSTARSLGVEDRTDVEESILAGARYLARRYERIPSFIPDPDRLWLALAAYNVGHHHLQDARRLAVDLGHNPNTWAGVKEMLPLLTEKRYYQDLPYGYARGHEPVVYVERVRNYQELLEESLPTEEPPPLLSAALF